MRWTLTGFALLILACLIAMFFRNPERVPPHGQGIVISPCDGTVVEIEIANTRIRGNVQLTKVDKDYPENHLSGAVFEVYQDTDGDQKLGKDDTLLGTMTELKTVARMLTRGQLRVNMELVGSEEPFQLLSDMVNRLTMALIVVGLFVGSSIVYYAGMKPIIFGIPVIGFMGYVVAFALGVWIVIDIYLKGRKTKKR